MKKKKKTKSQHTVQSTQAMATLVTHCHQLVARYCKSVLFDDEYLNHNEYL